MDGFFEAAYDPRLESGTKTTLSASSPDTTLTALDEVQHTSISALQAAVELTYPTTSHPGFDARASRIWSGVHIWAIEQMASGSGMSTVFEGFRILAVSAMKETPQKTMTSASVSDAAMERPSESPTLSAMSCTSGRQ